MITIETDHATLCRMLTQKKVTTRLRYWLDKLADFNFRVVYKPGKQNLVADALSRRPGYMEKVSLMYESRSQRRREDGHDERSTRLDWGKAYKECEDFRDIVCT